MLQHTSHFITGLIVWYSVLLTDDDNAKRFFLMVVHEINEELGCIINVILVDDYSFNWSAHRHTSSQVVCLRIGLRSRARDFTIYIHFFG